MADCEVSIDGRSPRGLARGVVADKRPMSFVVVAGRTRTSIPRSVSDTSSYPPITPNSHVMPSAFASAWP